MKDYKRQSVDIYNQLWSADPTHAQASDDLGTAGSLPYVPEGVYRVQIVLPLRV
jgi:hypothetical protein